jgi:pilus assembly protein CpaF
MQDIFVFRRRGRSDDGEVLGDFVATGIRPRCMEQLLAAGINMAPETFQNGAT